MGTTKHHQQPYHKMERIVVSEYQSIRRCSQNAIMMVGLEMPAKLKILIENIVY